MSRHHPIATAASVSAPAGASFAGTDLCTATGLQCPAGIRGPVFEQDVWDFTAVVGLPAYLQPSFRRLDFTQINNPRWRLVAKEYIAGLLQPGHEQVRNLPRARRTPLTLQTCALHLAETSRWLNWLTAKGVTTLAEVDERHCDAYVAHRAQRRDEHGTVISEHVNVRRQAIVAVVDLMNYRELFTTDRYQATLTPFGGRSATAAAGMSIAGENRTPVLPPELLQPMLAAALYLVQTLGPHIVAEHRRRKAQLNPPARARGGRTLVADITAALQRQIAERRPLERLPDPKARELAKQRATGDDPLALVSITALGREAGRARLTQLPMHKLRPVLENAVAQVGVEYPWGRNAAMVPRADGTGEVPWTEPVEDQAAFVLRRALRVACIIVVAAVSGMRASELLELAMGCRQQPTQVADGLLRYRITSKVIKGAPHGGLPDEWVVTKEVFDAVRVAELLLDDPEPGALLFAPCTFSTAYSYFRAWVNGPAGQRLGLATIPAGRVNLRMLRRTLAVELAYRPGGLLAAKIHLRHVSVVTTEGYANRPGGAQAKFLAEIGEEEQHRNLATLLAEYHNYRNNILPSGPGARELLRFFTSIDGPLANTAAPNVLPGDQQVRTMLTRRAATLHLGTANYCWFSDPTKALCLKLAGTPGATKPLIGMCDSARCPQATHHPCHRPVWAAAAEQHKAFLGTLSRAQKTERVRLQAEVDRAEQVVAAIDAANASPPAGGEPCHD